MHTEVLLQMDPAIHNALKSEIEHFTRTNDVRPAIVLLEVVKIAQMERKHIATSVILPAEQ